MSAVPSRVEQVGYVVIKRSMRDWQSIETFADCLSAVAADMKKHASKREYVIGDRILILFPAEKDDC